MKYHYIDTAIIRKNMLEDEDMIRQFVDMFLEIGQNDFEILRRYVEEQKIDDIGTQAHHIKPTLHYLGAYEGSLLLENLEHLAKQTTAFDDILAAFRHIEKHFGEILIELKHYRSTL